MSACACNVISFEYYTHKTVCHNFCRNTQTYIRTCKFQEVFVVSTVGTINNDVACWITKYKTSLLTSIDTITS